MTNSKLVSIIIPVYNAAHYLRECLDSVRAQKYQHWEAICIDDGCTDESGAILDSYAALDDRFRVIHQKNQGVSVARNEGLYRAQGEWVSCLDGDDKVLPWWLSVQIEFATKHNADIVHGHMRFWHGEDISVIEYQPSASPVVIRGGGDVLLWGWRTFFEIGCGTCELIFRRKLAVVGFPVGMRMKEDRIFNMSLLSENVTVVEGGFFGYLYRRHLTSACHIPRKSGDSIRFITEVMRIYKQQQAMIGQRGIECQIHNSLVHAIQKDFFEWMELSTWTDRFRSRELRKNVQRLLGDGYFPGCDLRFRWRLGYHFFARIGSFMGFYLVEAVFEFYRLIKRIGGRNERI